MATTLAKLMRSARLRSDTVNSLAVSDDEVIEYVNASLFELYDLLVGAYENYFVASPVLIMTSGQDQEYPLPSDYYKGLIVESQLMGSPARWTTVGSCPFTEKNKFNAVGLYRPAFVYGPIRYYLIGNSIGFAPVPSASSVFRLRYVPRLAQLVNPSDAVVDAFDTSGWLEYVCIDAAIKILRKEESDIKPALAEKMALKTRIEAISATRDAGSASVTVDNMFVDDFNTFGRNL